MFFCKFSLRGRFRLLEKKCACVFIRNERRTFALIDMFFLSKFRKIRLITLRKRKFSLIFLNKSYQLRQLGYHNFRNSETESEITVAPSPIYVLYSWESEYWIMVSRYLLTFLKEFRKNTF